MGRGGGRLGRGGAQQASWGQGRTVDTHRSPEGHVCSRPHAQGPKWAGERLCPLADPTGALFLGVHQSRLLTTSLTTARLSQSRVTAPRIPICPASPVAGGGRGTASPREPSPSCSG